MSNTVKRYLTFRLSEDAVLSKDDPSEFKGIICGSKDYLCIHVLAPAQFSEYAMAVIYSANGEEYPRPITDGKSDIPNEVTKCQHFNVKIVLQKGTQRIYTNGIEVYQSGKYDA